MSDSNPQNDHDLLIKMITKFDSFRERYDEDISSVKNDINNLNINVSKFGTRVAANNLATDERIRIIEQKTVQCETRGDQLKEDVDDLQARSVKNDRLLTFFTVLGSILGVIFGNKQLP